jgi:hypothetical protein
MAESSNPHFSTVDVARMQRAAVRNLGAEEIAQCFTCHWNPTSYLELGPALC